MSDPKSPTPKLAIVPDAEETEDEVPQIGYTLADQYRANVKLVSQAIDDYNLDHQAAVQLLGLTFNAHYTKIQLGLAAPVEG
jgi:hypothetical protein